MSQVALVAANIETKYKAQVIRTLVSGIANITNKTIGVLVKGRMLQAGMGIGSMTDDTFTQRLTIARSLSQVTNLIREDPEIITKKEKD